MRINVYSQEITPHIRLTHKRSGTDIVYSAIRLYLHSSDRLHYSADDDDRSAITFWLPKSQERRREIAQTFREMAGLVECAPPETGTDP